MIPARAFLMLAQLPRIGKIKNKIESVPWRNQAIEVSRAVEILLEY